MDEHRTILLHQTPTGTRELHGLSADLLAIARARLGKFVLFQTALLLAIALLGWLIGDDTDFQLPPGTLDRLTFAHFVGIAAHGFFYWVIRSPRFGSALVLDLGLAYQVVLCLTITMADQWINHHRTGSFNDLTYASLVIVAYPLIVPNPPWRTLVSSCGAAATIPGGIAILGLLGIPRGPDDYLISTISAVVSVAVAMFASTVVYGMQRAVQEARQLGSYRLETRLGQGGMGEVWLARHRFLARPAAIKLIRPEVIGGRGLDDTARVLARFEREAQATASMRSPHTIALYDFGVDAGTFYYVMELLDGLDLQSLVQLHGPVPAERAVHLLRQACDSLGEAHESNLIHRDIKPANLYVCRYGRERDFVKVLDFGLVKPGGGEEDVRLTAEQAIGGTPAFMAPEQILGNRPVDPRTDLYALGCVGYWLVTGKLVFEGASVVDTMMLHAKEPPVPPSHRTELPVPRDLEEALLACLEKSPEARPQTADELALRLDTCRELAPWTRERAFRWWEIHQPGDPPSREVPAPGGLAAAPEPAGRAPN